MLGESSAGPVESRTVPSVPAGSVIPAPSGRVVPDMVPSTSRCQRLLDRARTNPAGLRFRELIRLAECHGFERSRQKASHLVLMAEGLHRPPVVQNVKGSAKPYQVKQLLAAIDEMEAG